MLLVQKNKQGTTLKLPDKEGLMKISMHAKLDRKKKVPCLTWDEVSILTLTSRCMCPWWWRYSKPFNTSRSIVAITNSSKPSGYAAFSMWRQDPPAMNGMTTHRLWSLTKEQCDLRTLGWSTKTIVCASREMLFCGKVERKCQKNYRESDPY